MPENQVLYPTGEDYVTSDEVLKAYIDKYVSAQTTKTVGFVWQGGEPMLLGLDFYKRVGGVKTSLAKEPPIKLGTPDPYVPKK